MHMINLTSMYFALNFRLNGSAQWAAAALGRCNILPGWFGWARAAGGWPVDRRLGCGRQMSAAGRQGRWWWHWEYLTYCWRELLDGGVGWMAGGGSGWPVDR